MNNSVKQLTMLAFTMLLWLPEGCLAAAAAGNTKPAAPVRSGAAPAAQGKIVASIEGSKITLPPLLTLEARRERRMAGRAVNDPNLKLISDDRWMQMLDLRNELAHDYDGRLAKSSFALIVNEYIPLFSEFAVRAGRYIEDVNEKPYD